MLKTWNIQIYPGQIQYHGREEVLEEKYPHHWLVPQACPEPAGGVWSWHNFPLILPYHEILNRKSISCIYRLIKSVYNIHNPLWWMFAPDVYITLHISLNMSGYVPPCLIPISYMMVTTDYSDTYICWFIRVFEVAKQILRDGHLRHLGIGKLALTMGRHFECWWVASRWNMVDNWSSGWCLCLTCPVKTETRCGDWDKRLTYITIAWIDKAEGLGGGEVLSLNHVRHTPPFQSAINCNI